MKKTIVLGDEELFPEQEKMQQGREFAFFKAEEDAYLFHLENTDVDSYLLDVEKFSRNSLYRIIRHINYLNEIIAIFLLNTSEATIDPVDTANVKIFGTVKEFIEQLQSIPEAHRKYNRVRWPVSVVFHEMPGNDEDVNGVVTSISSGGCLIRAKVLPVPGTFVVMSIYFKNFDFLVEGEVLRAANMEFAVQFKNVSSQTQEIIQEIINEKLIVRLKDL